MGPGANPWGLPYTHENRFIPITGTTGLADPPRAKTNSPGVEKKTLKQDMSRIPAWMAQIIETVNP